MATKNKYPISYPGSQKIQIPGSLYNIAVGMREIKLQDSILKEDEDNTIQKKNNSVIVYDTSGPFSCSAYREEEDLKKIRKEWYRNRKDLAKKTWNEAKPNKQITQLSYAKRRIITPEMEYVAIRENQQIEALGLKSYITPEFVRKEIASRHAVIPSNINHMELEPMIIGRKFLVKVNGNLSLPSISNQNDIKDKLIELCQYGADTVNVSYTNDILNNEDYTLRNSPIPVICNPVLDVWNHLNRNTEAPTWSIFKEFLIEQAKGGIDMIFLQPGFLREHLEHLDKRLYNQLPLSSRILSEWMKSHKEENFLYTHFDEICTILKRYDVTLILGSGLRAHSIYDASDVYQQMEWKILKSLLTKECTELVQIITEGPSRQALNRVNENIKEHLYLCQNLPFLTIQPQVTDICIGYEALGTSIGAAQVAWHGASILSMAMKGIKQDKNEIRENICALKIAAHSADLAKGHPGSQIRDNAIIKASIEGRTKDMINLSLDPETTKKYYKKNIQSSHIDI